ncbi:MAG TPA: hypothetical protein VLJ86_01340 [Ramlibacter sp.]|nr:hypothetical protein [Ramlibacter sp.]
MSMGWRIRSLRLRLMVLVVSAATLVAGLLATWAHGQLGQELNADFAAQQDASMRRIARSVATPVWELNEEAVKEILGAQLAGADIVSIAVRDTAGSISVALARDARGEIVAARAEKLAAPELVVRELMRPDQQQEQIGQLTVGWSRARLHATLANNAQRLAAAVAVIDLLLIVLLFASLELVFRPIARLRDGLDRLAQDAGVSPGAALPAAHALPESVGLELAAVQRAFNRVLERMRDEAQRQQAALVGKARAGELAQKLQNLPDDGAFGRMALAYVSSLLEAPGCAFYLRGQGDTLFTCVASIGVDPARCEPFEPGDGLPGRVAASGEAMVLRDLPPDLLRIESGMLSVVPTAVALAPIGAGAAGGEVLAVLALAWLVVPEHHEQLLDDLLPVIAFALALRQGAQRSATAAQLA